MPWIFSDRLNEIQFNLWLVKKIFFLLTPLFFFTSCGQIYFPIELNTISRSDRAEKQQESDVVIVPMTAESIRSANRVPYRRYIIKAANLKEPAKLIPAEEALIEKFPINNDPGPYLIGVGDIIGYETYLSASNLNSKRVIKLIVNEDGLINFFQLGRIQAGGKTVSELEDLIYKKVIEMSMNPDFNLFISNFKSKYFSVSNQQTTKSFPYESTPIYVEQALGNLSSTILSETIDSKVSIFRGDSEYVFSYNKLLKNTQKKVRIFPGDRIFVNPLNYKKEKVLIVGETGAQRAIIINPFQRPSLSEAIFSGSVLNNTTSDFSQIYVLRKKKKVFQAFHLDITDPTRVSLANQFEMRPDDIVFVATQPLSLYSRTLSQILGSTGLTLQARDTVRNELGN